MTEILSSLYTPHFVRDTCSSFHSRIAWLDHQRIQEFVDTIEINELFDFVYSDTGLSTNCFTSDISFPSIIDEAGFLFLAHAIDFGSGFRPFLHKYRNGQGAWLTIRAGLINLGNRNPTCDSQWLQNLTLEHILEMFDLSYPELIPLAQFILVDLHEIGIQLLQNGYTTPGQFIQTNLHLGAVGLVNLFVSLFPLTFRDEYSLLQNGIPQRICFYKKAQLVVSEIFLRFSSSTAAGEISENFLFPDIDELTGFVDNVVVAMLRRYGIIQCTNELSEKISKEEAIEKGSEEEIALRACGVHGIEVLVKHLNEKLLKGESENRRKVNSQLVCNWFWGGLGKKGENRTYPRHLAPSTSYY
jgi:hypothetical protein